MSTAAKAVLPGTFFESVFRNMTDHSIYVPWASEGQGMNVPAGEHFSMLGDPRIPNGIPNAYGMIESIKLMMEGGVIEFCSSPAVIIDNSLPDGQSMALFSQGSSPYLGTVPLQPDELAARVLPTITPSATYDPASGKITVDWLAATGLNIHDKFLVLVTTPKETTSTIKCGTDRQTRYSVKDGDGVYKFTVVLTTVDDRRQDGTEIAIAVP